MAKNKSQSDNIHYAITAATSKYKGYASEISGLSHTNLFPSIY